MRDCFDDMSEKLEHEFFFMHDCDIFQILLELIHCETSEKTANVLFSKYKSLQDVIDFADFILSEKQININTYLLLKLIRRLQVQYYAAQINIKNKNTVSLVLK